METVSSVKTKSRSEHALAPQPEKTRDVVKENPGQNPLHILESIKEHLTAYERCEIEGYKRVYYSGLAAKKITPPGEGNVYNFGYDDDKGSYKLVLHDHIAYRYEILRVLGKGSFGQVVKAFDHKRNVYVALKVVRNEPRFHRQVREEVRILDFLRKLDRHDCYNVVHMLDAFFFRSHPIIIFDLHSLNLFELIKKNRFQGLPSSLVRKFGRSILHCLDLLYRHKIIHCDLKPENVLLREPGRTGIKVIDFGSSCYEGHTVYTYIQSRFYRAPEIILGLKYGMPIDIWSFGCILAELYTGMPLLQGETEGDQLALMMELLGQPPGDLLQNAKRKRYFFTDDLLPRYCQIKTGLDGKRILLGNISKRGRPRGPPGSKDLRKALKCEDDDFLDLICRCLQWKDEDRITPTEALKHPWMRTTAVVHPAIRESTTKEKASTKPSSAQQQGSQESEGSEKRPHEPTKSEQRAHDWAGPLRPVNEGSVKSTTGSLKAYMKEKLERRGEQQSSGKMMLGESLVGLAKHRRTQTVPARPQENFSEFKLDPDEMIRIARVLEERNVLPQKRSEQKVSVVVPTLIFTSFEADKEHCDLLR